MAAANEFAMPIRGRLSLSRQYFAIALEVTLHFVTSSYSSI